VWDVQTGPIAQVPELRTGGAIRELVLIDLVGALTGLLALVDGKGDPSGCELMDENLGTIRSVGIRIKPSSLI
jgi:hypothetical protein